MSGHDEWEQEDLIALQAIAIGLGTGRPAHWSPEMDG